MMRKIWLFCRQLPKWLAIALVQCYRYGLSPLLGPRCRYDPTCSAYALQALRRHGALQGGWLTLRRLARCHPWGGMGYDPVPDRPAATGSARGNDAGN